MSITTSDPSNSSPTPRKKAIIVGGGIAGPAVAMALQRAGHEAVVYEAHGQPADYAGLFLNTASNGLDVLRTLGVHTDVLEDAFAAPRMMMWSGTGKLLGEVANGVTLPDGTVSVIVRRGRLQRVLADAATRRGIRIEYGKRLAQIETIAPDRVRAHFDDGTTVEGDLLLGADGLHSRTRQLLDRAAPTPRYTGLLGVGGFARTPDIAPTPNTQHFIFGKRAFFGYLVKASGEIYWFANLAEAKEPSRAELAGISTDAWKERLRALFSDDSDIICKILDASTGPIGAHPIHDMPPIPTWHRGPIALIGDAAHATSPSSGQGASQALEDALVVARCLRDIPDTETALATYVGLRRARSEKVVAYSRKLGKGKAASGPIGRWLRDLFMPFALKHFASADAHAWLYTYHVDWNEHLAGPALRE